MKELENKTVLLLAPKFFGYENEIKKELENLGSKVIYFDERPKNDFLTKVILRLNLRYLIQYKIDKYYKNIINEIKNIKIDYLFLVNPETINIDKIKQIKRLNPNIKVYTYMWDSVKNKKKSLQYISVSDKFFTFDPNDTKINPKIRFLPLFYINDYKQIKSNDETIYDIAFIGTIHSDRYRIIKSLDVQDLKVFYYFYSPSKILFYLQKLFSKNFKNINPKDISFKALTKKEILEIISKSKAIIDIEHPHQKGLTMRTIEMIGARKKLITTNKNIKSYDFYNDSNICIIDRSNPEIERFFLKNKYKDLSKQIYNKYSLDIWVRRVFGHH